MCFSRVTPLALVSLLAALVARAQSDGLPAIFVESAPALTPLKLPAPAIVRPRLPLSPQIRAAMTERVAAASVAALPATPKPPPRKFGESYGDALMMDKFFVHARRERKIEVVSVPTYLARVLTTGEIWAARDKSATLNWGVRASEATGYGARASVPGFTLSITLRW